MDWVPADSAAVLHIAVPVVNVAASHPAIVVPFEAKETVPVGTPLPELTFALNVIKAPVMLGF